MSARAAFRCFATCRLWVCHEPSIRQASKSVEKKISGCFLGRWGDKGRVGIRFSAALWLAEGVAAAAAAGPRSTWAVEGRVAAHTTHVHRSGCRRAPENCAEERAASVKAESRQVPNFAPTIVRTVEPSVGHLQVDVDGWHLEQPDTRVTVGTTSQ